MFCGNCGSELTGNEKFCSKCGQPIRYLNTQVLYELSRKEKTSFYIWIVIATCQILIGFLYPASWGCAIWNFIGCYMTYRFSQKILKEPVGIYKQYSNELTTDIIFLVINLLFGGVIGVVAVIYDIHTRQYAMEHRDDLLAIEDDFVRQNYHRN